jgi:hypothetical protein
MEELCYNVYWKNDCCGGGGGGDDDDVRSRIAQWYIAELQAG